VGGLNPGGVVYGLGISVGMSSSNFANRLIADSLMNYQIKFLAKVITVIWSYQVESVAIATLYAASVTSTMC
jgi:hypothetical protein